MPSSRRLRSRSRLHTKGVLVRRQAKPRGGYSEGQPNSTGRAEALEAVGVRCTLWASGLLCSPCLPNLRTDMAQDTDYRLVATARRAALEKEVNQALSEGWKLYGSPTVTGNLFLGYTFAQAMVRGKTAKSVYENRGPQPF